MLTADEIRQKLTGVFDEAQTAALAEVLKGVAVYFSYDF
jgi:hypothetical protein